MVRTLGPQRSDGGVVEQTGTEAVSGDNESRLPAMMGPVAVASVALGLGTWPVAFNLGAYRQVFCNDVFSLVVASFILLVITFLVPPYPPAQNWLIRSALALPSLWMVSAAVVVSSTSEAVERPVFVVGLVAIGVVSVPLTLKMLVDLFTPEMKQLHSRRLTMWVVAVVAAVALAGFIVGRENHRFLTCDDFTVAGSSTPDNCEL